MSNELNYTSLKNVVTPEVSTEVLLLPNQFIDADDELRPIAEYVKVNTVHNNIVKPERIKFLYTTKPKKEAGRYTTGDLILRSEMEKMVNDDFDYIITVYYPVWKGLDVENKVIQMDKILCGVDLGGGLEEDRLKKKQKDTREHTDNLNFFGPDKVLHSSEMIHIATVSAIEKLKEESRKVKEGAMEDANKLDEQ